MAAAGGDGGSLKAEGLYKLSDLAASLEVEAGVLRLWEKEFSQFIKPLKAGPRKKLYRPEELEVFRTIKSLLQEGGFTIAGARRRLAEAGGQGFLFEETGDLSPGEAGELRKILAEVRRDLLDLRRFLASGPTPPGKAGRARNSNP